MNIWCLSLFCLLITTACAGGSPTSERTHGVLTSESGVLYEGELLNGLKDGHGVQTWPDGARFEGEFKKGVRTGPGLFIWPDGARFTGQFVQGKKEGKGIFSWPDGSTYEGEFKEGKKHGTGLFTSANKTVEVCYQLPKQLRQVWEEDRQIESQEIPPQLPTGTPSRSSLPTIPGEAKLTLSTTLFTKPAAAHIDQQPLPPLPASPDTWSEPTTGLTFVHIPSGCFNMGSTLGKEDEKPVHKVCLDDFWLGKFEVTQKQWYQIMGGSPPSSLTAEHPIGHITWNQIALFIDRLNQRAPQGYRLPSEAEWEYACRGGSQEQSYCGGENYADLAWFKENSDSSSHPVGEKKPNNFGLYDMTGNVWEWVADRYDPTYYQQAPEKNPPGASMGSTHVFRGGAWLSTPDQLRATARHHLSPDRGYGLLGFRLRRNGD
ncbi:MAG: SUMF1/EgtB/PvdO family nonheme iron enzyme [Magnetococcus sp. DMHC-6]